MAPINNSGIGRTPRELATQLGKALEQQQAELKAGPAPSWKAPAASTTELKRFRSEVVTELGLDGGRLEKLNKVLYPDRVYTWPGGTLPIGAGEAAREAEGIYSEMHQERLLSQVAQFAEVRGAVLARTGDANLVKAWTDDYVAALGASTPEERLRLLNKTFDEINQVKPCLVFSRDPSVTGALKPQVPALVAQHLEALSSLHPSQLDGLSRQIAASIVREGVDVGLTLLSGKQSTSAEAALRRVGEATQLLADHRAWPTSTFNLREEEKPLALELYKAHEARIDALKGVFQGDGHLQPLASLKDEFQVDRMLVLTRKLAELGKGYE